MLIIGEVYNNFVKICILERVSDTWMNNNESYFIPALTPIYIDIPLDIEKERTIFIFKSSKGKVRKGSVSNKIESCYVVACNNRHVYYKNTIWEKIEKNPVDMIVHLGDQTYSDRLFWDWFYKFDKLPKQSEEEYSVYKEDIEKDYYREYLDTWEPLENVLSHTSSIMIPDDHEARSRADIWTENVKEGVADKLSKNLKYYLIDENKNKRTKLKEEYIFKVAFDLCRGLYLGLRFTNRDKFDYSRRYNLETENEFLLICTERISHALFDEEFYNSLPKLKENERVLVCSGLPPLPIRENFAEMVLYRHPQTIPDSVYDDFCKKFEGTNFIAIGGDIHIGSTGKIVNRKTKSCIGRFHTTGPSSGFTSFN